MQNDHDARFSCERAHGGFAKDGITANTKGRWALPVIVIGVGLGCALLTGSAMADTSITPSSIFDSLNWIANELLRLKTK